MRLQNKVSIVTGAAHGIGRAIAYAFADEGAAVLVADIDEQAGEETAADIRKDGRPASFVRCDVSAATDIEHAVKIAGEKTGRIDVLCNNAALLGPWHDVATATAGGVGAVASASRCSARRMFTARSPAVHAAAPRGSIINVASIQGIVARSHVGRVHER